MIRLPMRLLTCAALCLLVCCGCKHFPESPQPLDPLPHDYWTQDVPPPELLDQLRLLTEEVHTLRLRLDRMETELADRSLELRQTRGDHSRALQEIGAVRGELSSWQAALTGLQDRLARQDDQRQMVLGEVAERIDQISRSMQQP
jgi:hypothetical protein